MRRQTKLILSFALLAVSMGITWFFSSSTGSDSNAISRKLAHRLMIFVGKLVTIEPQDVFWTSNLNWLLRKLGHMTEYFLLGAFALTFFDIWLQKLRFAFPLALGTAFFWAMADEFRQNYIPNRTGNWFDVGVDMVGASLGALFASILLAMIHTYFRQKARIKELETSQN